MGSLKSYLVRHCRVIRGVARADHMGTAIYSLALTLSPIFVLRITPLYASYQEAPILHSLVL